MNRFEEWFWLGNDTAVAINSLNGKVSQGHAEVQEIVTFFQEFVNVHEHYASTIRAIQKKPLAQLFPLGNAVQGFEGDEGGSLKQAFYMVRDESLRLAEEHADLASLIKQHITGPLKLWVDEGKKIFKTKKTEFESLQRNFDRARQEVVKKKQAYESACRAFDAVKTNAETAEDRVPAAASQPTPDSNDSNVTQFDIVTNVGPLSLSAKELSNFLSTVQNTLKHRDIKYPLLGVFRVFTGEDFVVHLQQQGQLFNMSTGFTPEAAIKIGQDLMDLGYIRLVGVGQKKFVAKDNWQYQWKKTAEVLLQEKALGAKREVDVADEGYKSSVVAAEKVYQEYEKGITELLHFIQTVEMTRITSVKKALTMFTSSLQALGQNVTKCAQTMLIALESVQADKDIEVLCEQYKTGLIRPQPLLYENYYKDPAEECLFAVSLRNHCNHSRTRVPWIVSETLKAIDFQTKDEPYETVLVTWLNAMDVDVNFLHAIRAALNHVDPIPAETLCQQFSAPMLIAVLRRYLMELPYPLIFEEYERIKTLYISKTQEKDVLDRIHSVREIICTLPKSHFHTLNYFLKYLNRFFIQPLHPTNIEKAAGAPLSAVEFLGSNKFADSNIPTQFNLIASFWGPIIIRSTSLGTIGFSSTAEDEDALYMSYDHHPERVLKDMILNYDELFLGGHLKPAGSSRDKSPEKQSQVPNFPRRPSISSSASDDETNDTYPNLPTTKRNGIQMETVVLSSVMGGLKERRRSSIVSQENVKDLAEVPLDSHDRPVLNERVTSLSQSPSTMAKESPVSLLHSLEENSLATLNTSPPPVQVISPESVAFKTLNISEGSPNMFKMASPEATDLQTVESPIEDIVDIFSPVVSPEKSPEPVFFQESRVNDSPKSLALSPSRQMDTESVSSPVKHYVEVMSPKKSPTPVDVKEQISQGSPISVNLLSEKTPDVEVVTSPQHHQAEKVSPKKSPVPIQLTKQQLILDSPASVNLSAEETAELEHFASSLNNKQIAAISPQLSTLSDQKSEYINTKNSEDADTSLSENNLEFNSSPDMLTKSALSPNSPDKSPEPSPKPFLINSHTHDPLTSFESGLTKMEDLMSPEAALNRVISPVRAFDSKSPSKSSQDYNNNSQSFSASPVYYEVDATDDEESSDGEEFLPTAKRLSHVPDHSPPLLPPTEPPLSPDPVQTILAKLPQQLDLDDNANAIPTFSSQKTSPESITYEEVTDFAYESDEDLDNDSQPMSPNFIKQYNGVKVPPLSQTEPPSVQPREEQPLKRATHPDSDDDVDALDY